MVRLSIRRPAHLKGSAKREFEVPTRIAVESLQVSPTIAVKLMPCKQKGSELFCCMPPPYPGWESTPSQLNPDLFFAMCGQKDPVRPRVFATKALSHAQAPNSQKRLRAYS